MLSILITIVLVSNLKVNCIELIDTDTLTNTTIPTTITTKPTIFEPIVNSSHKNSTILSNSTHNHDLSILAGYENTNNKTIQQYLGDNKLVIKSGSNNDAVVKTATNTTSNLTLTLIIIVIGVVFVIIIIIISALFIMRRRFSKWRLNIMDPNGCTNLTNDDGKNSGDNASSTNDALISKQSDDHVVIEVNNEVGNCVTTNNDDNVKDNVKNNDCVDANGGCSGDGGGDNVSNTDDALISNKEQEEHTADANSNGNCIKANE